MYICIYYILYYILYCILYIIYYILYIVRILLYILYLILYYTLLFLLFCSSSPLPPSLLSFPSLPFTILPCSSINLIQSIRVGIWISLFIFQTHRIILTPHVLSEGNVEWCSLKYVVFVWVLSWCSVLGYCLCWCSVLVCVPCLCLKGVILYYIIYYTIYILYYIIYLILYSSFF